MAVTEESPKKPTNPREEDDHQYWDCPECGAPLCDWTDCARCGWYDADAWRDVMMEDHWMALLTFSRRNAPNEETRKILERFIQRLPGITVEQSEARSDKWQLVYEVRRE